MQSNMEKETDKVQNKAVKVYSTDNKGNLSVTEKKTKAINKR